MRYCQTSDERLRGKARKSSVVKAAAIVFVFCFLAVTASPGQITFTTLLDFNGSVEAYPQASLMQGFDGNYYGTTAGSGGLGGRGTVFKITPSGAITTLYSFCAQTNCVDGADPAGTVVQADDGNFYGTTVAGGTDGVGTVFKITPDGSLTTLYSFCGGNDCTGGKTPLSGLALGADGNLYGTTANGGKNDRGTAFRITPTGALTTLHRFCIQTNCLDGGGPQAGLVQASDGAFYGTTTIGGTGNIGTVFKITSAGKLTVLHSFGVGEGSQALAQLIQVPNGDFYGTTEYGGAHTGGTIFKMTSAGKVTVLYSFCSQTDCVDGKYPIAGLVQGTDGNLYGTTYYGGDEVNQRCQSESSCGTIFKITRLGALTTLYNLCSQTDCSDGASPWGGLIQATNGTFYGVTEYGGGSEGAGTAFSLSIGLGPFVKLQPTFGQVGRTVIILGNNLAHVTGVTFNGTAAPFTIVSSTEITTTVPSGATTGTVEVQTLNKTLKSNVAFVVTP